MGKKRKKIVAQLSNQELVPSTIGYVDENKSGPFALIFLFAIFIAVAVFLPQITDYANKLLGRDTDTIENGNNPGTVDDGKDNEKDKDKEKQKDTMHDFSNTLSFVYDGLEFKNFNVLDGKLYVTIKNTNKNKVNFTSTKYFIETYDNSNTMLGRHIIDNFAKEDESIESILESDTIKSINFSISTTESTNISKVIIVTEKVDDYPTYELENNVLTCNNYINGISTIVYTYSKDEIVSIKDTQRVSKDTADNYTELLTKYSTRASVYNNVDGVASNIVELSNGFTMTTDITYSKLKEENLYGLNNTRYYVKNTEPKVVKFEMEARGYSCK